MRAAENSPLSENRFGHRPKLLQRKVTKPLKELLAADMSRLFSRSVPAEPLDRMIKGLADKMVGAGREAVVRRTNLDDRLVEIQVRHSSRMDAKWHFVYGCAPCRAHRQSENRIMTVPINTMIHRSRRRSVQGFTGR